MRVLWHTFCIWFSMHKHIRVRTTHCVRNIKSSHYQWRSAVVSILSNIKIKQFQFIAEKIPTVVICSIAHDNLPAQVAGLTGAHQNDLWKNIINVPCLNHMVNLVYNHIVSRSAGFSAIPKGILTWNRIMKDKTMKQHVGSSPSIPETRWIYTLDLLDFMEAKIEKLMR